MFTKALHHHSGWYMDAEEEYLEDFMKAFGLHFKPKEEMGEPEPKKSDAPSEDAILSAIKESGFDYVDKRAKGGALWIITGESEAANLIDNFRKLGVDFIFTEKGGKATGHKPGWYAKF